MSSLGFGSQAGPGSATSNRGNGLLNALSANSRAIEARSPPPGIGAPGTFFFATISLTHNAHTLRFFKTAGW
jgi:hypothetical protein